MRWDFWLAWLMEAVPKVELKEQPGKEVMSSIVATKDKCMPFLIFLIDNKFQNCS